jgi:hypothetical protein
VLVLAPRVSPSGHEPEVRSLLGSWGGHEFDSFDPLVVRLPSMDHREVHRGFCVRFSLEKMCFRLDNCQ